MNTHKLKERIIIAMIISGISSINLINAQTQGAGNINSLNGVGTSGTNRCFIGDNAGHANTTGSNNAFIGYDAGQTNTTGSNNTILGYNSDFGSNNLSNAAAIGSNITVKNSNNLLLGDNSTHVGINLSNDATGASSVLSVGGNGNSLFEAYIKNPNNTNSVAGLRVETAIPSGTYNMYAIQGFQTSGIGNMFAVEGYSYNSTVQTSGRAYGTYGIAGNATSGYNYGAYGYLLGSNNGAGVFGTTNGDYAVPGKYAGFFNGNLRMTTDSAIKTSTNTWYVSSDKRLKKDIAPFKDGLNVIRKINPVTYKFTGAGGLPNTQTNIGVLAQDVKPIAPYCVGSTKMIMKQADASAFGSDVLSSFKDSSGTMDVVNTLTFNTHGLFYAMLNSIKQLDSIVSVQQTKLAALEATPQRTMGSSDANHPSTDVELASKSAILYQNAPNPFGDGTVIRYFIPENSTNAKVLFYDEFGNQIKDVTLTNKGVTADLNVATLNLAQGIYSYSMIVDGKVIDTKKMIKSK